MLFILVLLFTIILSHDSHFTIDCNVSTTNCGSSSGDAADLLSYNVLTISNTMVNCDWGIMNLT